MKNALRIKQVAVGVFAALALVTVRADESIGLKTASVLWPGDSKALLRPQKDTTLRIAADGSAEVDTGSKEQYPGARLDFEGGRDLSPYANLTVAVSNRSEKAVTVMVSVKGINYPGQTPGGLVLLLPHAVGEIEVDISPLPWRLDRKLDFYGMNGYPIPDGGVPGVFDISRVDSIHIFTGNEVNSFAIRMVKVGGRRPKSVLLKADSFMPFVDPFGQFKHGTWPGKAADKADLAADAKEEKAWLEKNAAGTIPEADEYGGWKGGPKLKATGFFRTEKVKGKWWFVDPNGCLFFSHGITCVSHGSADTGVTGRECYFNGLPAREDADFGRFYGQGSVRYLAKLKDGPKNPCMTFDFAGANMLRKYGPRWWDVGIALAHKRLRAWGFNTMGCWSSESIYAARGARTPYTVALGTDGTPRMKDAKTGKDIWGTPDPFAPEFERKIRAEAKRAAVRMKDDPWCLGVFVDNEINWFDTHGFDPAPVAEKYYSTVAKVMKDELPNHLYLGSRIASGGPEIYRAAAKSCDVVTANVYESGPNRALPVGSVDKPMLIGEFHFGATDRGMFHSGMVAAKDQADRAERYRRYVQACLDNPQFVGAHWFQWKDQPLTGRFDGENFGIGFLSVTDRPYPELVKASREIGAEMYARRHGKAEKPELPPVRLARHFCENMVLQQGKPIPIWGWAKKGARVEVRFAGQSHVTTADGSRGDWKVVLPATKASKKVYWLVATEFDPAAPERPVRRTILKNVLVGEVWIISGQSNMGFRMSQSADFQKAKARADYPFLRYMHTYTYAIAMEPTRDSPPGVCWVACTPGTVGSFSAVGFHFAERLMLDLDVPVGLVSTQHGGTSMPNWTPHEFLSRQKLFKRTLEQYERQSKEWVATNGFAGACQALDRCIAKYMAACEKAKAGKGPWPWWKPESAVGYTGWESIRIPSAHWNAKVAPLAGLAIAGVLWYQGETESWAFQEGDPAWQFGDMLGTMIEGWRAAWQEDIPFVVAQLPSKQPDGQGNYGWPATRSRQRQLSDSMKLVMSAPTLDSGDRCDVHPKDKEIVGERLERVARRMVYGDASVALPPVFKSAELTEKGACVTFVSEAGLVGRGEPRGFQLKYGQEWLEARPTLLDDGRVLVAAPAGRGKPDAVHYLWKGWDKPDVWLYDRQGVPVSSFSWPFMLK